MDLGGGEYDPLRLADAYNDAAEQVNDLLDERAHLRFERVGLILLLFLSGVLNGFLFFGGCR